MFRVSKQIVGLSLVLMVFQFLVPAFMPMVVPGMPFDNSTSYKEHHNSVVAPMLFKEKDEKEHEEFFSVSESTPLLDLDSHSFNLAASHENINAIIPGKRGFVKPTLITLHCTFLI